MKSNSKKMIKLSVILYGVLLCVVLVATLAWFVFDKTAGIQSENDMTITAGYNLEISTNGESWGQKIEHNVTSNLIDITGDGVNFYSPSVLDANDGAFLGDSSSFVYVNERDDKKNFFVDVKLHFRTTGSTSVYLQNSSWVKGADISVTDAMGGTVPNDAIAGAVRVAFYDITGKEEGYQPVAGDLKCIWIPTDKYQITENAEGALSFNEIGTPEASYGYLAKDGNEMDEIAWTDADYTSGKVIVGTAQLATNSTTANGTYPMINHAPSLLDFSGNGLEEKTMLIRIWIEGTDREAHTYLNGGEIQYNFEFITIGKSEPSDEDIAALDRITYSDDALQTGELNILYSYDGITWASYGTTNHPGLESTKLHTNANEQKVIYIKSAETAGTKASEPREVIVE